MVDKIYALQREKEEAIANNVNYNAGKERIEEMIEYLKSRPKRVTAYDERLVRKLIEKIIIFDDHLDFLFKSGIRLRLKGKLFFRHSATAGCFFVVVGALIFEEKYGIINHLICVTNNRALRTGVQA